MPVSRRGDARSCVLLPEFASDAVCLGSSQDFDGSDQTPPFPVATAGRVPVSLSRLVVHGTQHVLGPRLHHPGHRQRLRSAPQQTVALSSRPQAGLGGQEQRQLPEVRRHLVPLPVGQLDRPGRPRRSPRRPFAPCRRRTRLPGHRQAQSPCRSRGPRPAHPPPSMHPESGMREPLHRTILSGLRRTVGRLPRATRDAEPVPVHFLHVGKTGGTAIKHAIGGAQAPDSGDRARLPYVVHLHRKHDLVLPDDDVQSHANPRHLDRTLGDTAVANLHKWYEEDFRFLKLCERVVRECPHVRSGRPPVAAGWWRRLVALRAGGTNGGS